MQVHNFQWEGPDPYFSRLIRFRGGGGEADQHYLTITNEIKILRQNFAKKGPLEIVVVTDISNFTIYLSQKSPYL